MDLKHLRTFVTVAEQGTVSKAAARLHVAQPALSRRIIDLESELGIALFDRVGRRLRLTGEGEQFLAHCRSVLAQFSSLAERARELRHGDSGSLTVAGSPQMIDNVFAPFLHEYAARYPAVQVRLVEGFGDATLAMVERGDVNLGVIVDEAVPPGADHFGHLALVPNAHTAVWGRSFRLPRTIEICNLASHPLFVLDTRHVQRRKFDAACRLARVRPNIIFEGSSPHSLLSLAEAGHGVAVVPSNVRLHRYAVKATRVVHEGQRLAEPLSIFWDVRRSQPRYAGDFCVMLQRYHRKQA
jgi:DNA-binding transcriptional LysR family regulator